jgi:hypothetical protein
MTSRSSPYRRSSIQFNPEFLSTIATVGKLISNMEAVKERVEGMWHTRGEKLEATYKQQTFEKEANQVRAKLTAFHPSKSHMHTGILHASETLTSGSEAPAQRGSQSNQGVCLTVF